MKKLLAVLLTLFLFTGVSMAEVKGNDKFVKKLQTSNNYTQVQALHILVPTESEAIRIRNEIMTGQNSKEIFNNFMNAAKKYSKCPSGSSGGILGWFGHGDMVPEFEKAAFELPNGEVSQPVKTAYGWHLIYDISKK